MRTKHRHPANWQYHRAVHRAGISGVTNLPESPTRPTPIRSSAVGPPVGVIVGSIAKDSTNRALARRIAERAEGVLALTEVPIIDLPLYDYGVDEAFPPVAVEFKRRVEAVDTLLFVTPEYNRSIPGSLKNALDWGSRPWGDNSFAGKRAAIVGTGLNSAGTAVAQSQLRGILGYLGAQLISVTEVCLPWTTDLLEQEATRAILDGFIAELRSGTQHG